MKPTQMAEIVECIKKEIKVVGEAKAASAARMFATTEAMVKRKATGNEKYLPVVELFAR